MQKDITQHDGRPGKIVHLCSYCGSTRNELGEWQANHPKPPDQPNLFISHGLCPFCARKLYPELFPDRIAS